MGTLYAATLGQSPGVAHIYIYINTYTVVYISYLQIYIISVYIRINIWNNVKQTSFVSPGKSGKFVPLGPASHIGVVDVSDILGDWWAMAG